jgi:ABC-type dipeptide/oligopeptide/nickel transport system ATPase component
MRILEVRNLQTRFATNNAGHAAVDGISFELNRGETLGIVANLVQVNRSQLFPL